MRTAAAEASERGSHSLHLYVSNQSFDIDPVYIDVYIDGTAAVSQQFEVRRQHNWILFELELTRGEHELLAVGEDGEVQLQQSFSISDDHWAVIDFWFYPDEHEAPFFTWRIQDEPVAFL